MSKTLDIKNILSKNPIKLEEKILKAIFKRNDAITDIIDIIDAKSFTTTEYASIYTAMLELYKSENSDINIETVQIWLESHGYDVDDAIISKLYNEAYTSIKIVDTALVLKELTQRRFMLQSIRDILDKEEQTPTSSIDILENINDIAMKSNDKVSSTNRSIKCGSDPNKVMKDIELKLSGKLQEKGLLTGLGVIDNELQGLKRGKLWVIAADSQVGKSQLALQLAMKACMKNEDVYVDYYSLEMTTEEVQNRCLSIITGIEPNCITEPKKYFNRYDSNTGKIYNIYDNNKNAQEVLNFKKDIKNGLDLLNTFNFYCDDTPDLNTDSLIARIKKNNLKRGKTDIIVIDHAGIACSGSPSEVVGLMDDFYNKMKQIAKKLNCTVICLHQFGTEIKQDECRRPNIFSLRGSSAARHYSDVIALLYRPDVYKDVIEKHPELKGHCDLTFAKVRYTKQPDVTLMSFNGIEFTEKMPTQLQSDIKENNVSLNLDGELFDVYDEDDE